MPLFDKLDLIHTPKVKDACNVRDSEQILKTVNSLTSSNGVFKMNPESKIIEMLLNTLQTKNVDRPLGCYIIGKLVFIFCKQKKKLPHPQSN